MALEGGSVWLDGRLRKSDVCLDEKVSGTSGGKEILDCTGKWVLPGLIDCHVHFRVPGAEHKEDWKTGSIAAAHGGITTVMDMPNTNPPTTTIGALEQKTAIAQRDSVVRFALHFGASNGNISEAESAKGIRSIKMYMGSSTGNLLVESEAEWKKWFGLCARRNLVMVVHAEHEPRIKANSERFPRDSAKMHNKIRDSEVEETAVRNAIRIAMETGSRLHVAHLSSELGLEAVREAKEESGRITCEVCPHHLFLSENDIERLGNFGKMNPPLRSKEDAKALWKGLNDGTIDCISTDHAPHTIEEKNQAYGKAPSGVPGVETMLPLLLDAVSEERIGLETIVRCCCENPARIFGFNDRARLEEGFLGDAVIVDPEEEWAIKGSELLSKCGWTPFEGISVKGRVEKTIVGGGIVFGGTKKPVVR